MVLKPSEKVPLTMSRVMELLRDAGLPKGVVNLVHGTAGGWLSHALGQTWVTAEWMFYHL